MMWWSHEYRRARAVPPAAGRRRLLAAAGAAVVGTAVVAGLAAPLTSHADTSHRPESARSHVRAGVMPKQGPATQAQSAAPAGAHLNYYGGHVISNVHVTQILYGSGPYETEVQSTASPSIATFYQGVTNSSYYDWLSEYNTTVVGGTNQVIGRGQFTQQIQITPSAANDGATIDDTNIQAELQAQISAGHIPVPDANTLLAVYFPDSKTITQGGQSSGVQFCAYHGTVAASGSLPEFYYSILPGFGSPGMSAGCGSGTEFQNVTSVSSHELVEATTDAEVGLATTNGPPLAWYDPTNGEIGDICNGQQQAIVGGDGVTYTVQQEWSNQQNTCVVSGPAAANDFSMSASPSSLTLASGASGTSTIGTAVTSGSAGTISLTLTGVPAGASASLSPTSTTAGGSSTLSVHAGTAAAGSYTLTVTGTEGSTSHSASVALTVTSGGGGGGGLVNGGFDSGSLSGWTASGTVAITTSTVQSGADAARVGGTSPSTDSSLSQTFTVPGGATQLSFWYDNFCPDTVTYDWASASLKDNTAGTTTTPLARTCNNPSSGGFKHVTAPVTAGHSYTLTLSNHDDNYPGDPTYTVYDSVAVTGTTQANDFSISNTGGITLNQGASGSTSITTALVSGSVPGITLSIGGLPGGAAAAFNPTSVAAGGSSTLTVSTASNTPTGSYTLTVTGSGSGATHSTTLTLKVNAPITGGLVNGGFETGTFAGWTTGGASTSIQSVPRSGAYSAMAGSTVPTNGDSTISQTFTAPTGTSRLSLYYANNCPDTVTYDWVRVTLRDNTTGTTTTVVGATCAASYAWTNATAPVTPGHSYTLTLLNHDDNYGADPTYTLFDDIGLS